MRRPLPPLVLAGLSVLVALASPSRGGEGREIPPAYAPLEYLVGSWKGQGVSLDDPTQRVRGWTETHAWAWSFVDGKPAGMTVKLEKNKQIKSASLGYDEARKKYVLKADPVASGGGTIAFEGTLDGSGKLLTLDRTGVPAGRPAERLTLRANSNYVRYTLGFERRASRGGTFARSMEVGLTKEGETFAAGSAATEAPKCVVTGGAATQTVSYEGRTFPICCSGCRDEFLDAPDKYLKKLAAAPAPDANANKKPSPPARRPRGDDDAFAGDVEEPKAKP
ncbi:YHS domain-containing protein [Paludisphaera soli]|uniref:YHS domain-containing protein n=1 Tax=Paludisphaera soli TaxID=2712865 RepID=UPI0013EC923A|nr:YHS domain-containing protein [Paludisphaera soli]